MTVIPTYKEAISAAMTCIKFSEEKIAHHDYGHGEWEEHRRNELLRLYEVRLKLRQLKDRL